MLYVKHWLILLIGWFSCAYAQEVQPIDSLNKKGLGPSSVSEQITSENQRSGDFLKEYFNFKKRFSDKQNFSYGIDYLTSYQLASASLENLDKDAFSGAFRIFGEWGLVGKKTGNTGSFLFKVENRHVYNGFASGQDLASNIGYVGLNTVPFSDAGWILTNFYWKQQFLQNRLAFVAGIIDVTDYTNVYGLVNPWLDFSNLMFSTAAHIPTPNQGLGIAVRGMITDHIYALVGISDANGDPSDPGCILESFFKTAEYFTQVEVGWIKSDSKRFSDNIHLLYWHTDARKDAQIDSGWGLAFSFSRSFNSWEPFFRAGFAEGGGTLLESSIDFGSGYKFNNKSTLGLGLGWGIPNSFTFGSDLKNQFTVESYYQIYITKIFTLIPDVQLLFNPALNPSKDFITVFGVRGRIAI